MGNCIKPSYNPFLLFGSYLGAVILFLSQFIQIPQTILGYIGFNQILVVPFQDTGMFVYYTAGTGIIGWILTSIVGFLIGWGIHSSIRKSKYKKCSGVK